MTRRNALALAFLSYGIFPSVFVPSSWATGEKDWECRADLSYLDGRQPEFQGERVAVRKATREDATQIFAVARLNQYDPTKTDPGAGFLVLAKSIETYQSYIDRGIGTVVAEADGKVVGFSIFANSLSADARDDRFEAERAGQAELLKRLEPNLYFVVQVGVHPDFKQRRVGPELYAAMYAEHPQSHFAANLVEEPAFNIASQKFHTRQGFVRRGQAVAERGPFGSGGMKLGVYFREHSP